MILRAGDVVDLQYFLMDVAKRYAAEGGERARFSGDLLSSAAALDYALLLASEHGDEPLAASDPVTASIGQTMTRAANCALDLAESMVKAPSETFEDFARRYIRKGGVFETIRALRQSGAVEGSETAFRALTVANDLIERRQRERR